jgi:hypothetical protein
MILAVLPAEQERAATDFCQRHPPAFKPAGLGQSGLQGLAPSRAPVVNRCQPDLFGERVPFVESLVEGGRRVSAGIHPSLVPVMVMVMVLFQDRSRSFERLRQAFEKASEVIRQGFQMADDCSRAGLANAFGTDFVRRFGERAHLVRVGRRVVLHLIDDAEPFRLSVPDNETGPLHFEQALLNARLFPAQV